jgi:hypothetical protein
VIEPQRDFKRVLAMGDTHCGHFVGLTPPAWLPAHRPEWIDVQLKMWNFFAEEVKSLGHIDVCFGNGDLVDGKGKRSGSVEQFEVDMVRQEEMAADILNFINADETVITRGTPYHVVNEGRDSDNEVGKAVGATVSNHPWVDVNGTIFDIKHKIGGSSTPYGRATPLAKEALWNQLWSAKETNPRATVVLRSHVHFHTFTGDTDYLAMTLPALQGPGSLYGEQQCSGMVHFGFVSFDCYPGGKYSWKQHIIKTVVKQQALKL